MSRTFADSLDADLDVFFNTNEFGVSCTLTRGDQTTSGLAAIVTVRQHDITDESGESTVFESVDFQLRSADYEIDSETVDPRSGDRLAAGGKTYEVLPIPGLGCFDRSIDDSVLTVHCKRIA